GARGEVVYHHGAGEIGQAIERIFSSSDRPIATGTWRATFPAPVAHGVREKLPAFAPDATFCAELTLVDVVPPGSPPPGASACAEGEEWFCQLGPTSVDNKTSARGCGCGYQFCPKRTL